jgi:hypothetical protein
LHFVRVKKFRNCSEKICVNYKNFKISTKAISVSPTSIARRLRRKTGGFECHHRGSNTTLENQISGSYEELGNDFLLLASARSIDEEVKIKPATEISKGKLNVLRVMQRQVFNQDDIQDFKNPQVAREGNDGLLKFFETERTKTNAGFKEFSSAIIAEENEDRIMATNENFTNSDLPKVKKISTSINHDNTKPGAKIQQEDGNWSTHEPAGS